MGTVLALSGGLYGINHFHGKWFRVSAERKGMDEATLTCICTRLCHDDQLGTYNRGRILYQRPYKSWKIEGGLFQLRFRTQNERGGTAVCLRKMEGDYILLSKLAVLLRYYEWPFRGKIEFNIQNKVSSENSSYTGKSLQKGKRIKSEHILYISLIITGFVCKPP